MTATALATPTGRRFRFHLSPGLIGVTIAALLLAGLIVVAGTPTGAAGVRGVVPEDGRLIADRPLGGVHVLLVSRNGPLQVIVAYRGEKGWLGLHVPEARAGAQVAWTATDGRGPVPALSALYGRVNGTGVIARWSDGATERIALGADGAFLAVRRGAVRPSSLSVLGPGGTVIREVPGP
jgi:hypothetical protein